PLILHAAFVLLRANTHSDYTFSEEALALFAIQETVRHITLPGPAHEMRSPTLDCHGICCVYDQPVDRLLDHEQCGQTRQQAKQSCIIGLSTLRQFASRSIHMP